MRAWVVGGCIAGLSWLAACSALNPLFNAGQDDAGGSAGGSSSGGSTTTGSGESGEGTVTSGSEDGDPDTTGETGSEQSTGNEVDPIERCPGMAWASVSNQPLLYLVLAEREPKGEVLWHRLDFPIENAAGGSGLAAIAALPGTDELYGVAIAAMDELWVLQPHKDPFVEQLPLERPSNTDVVALGTARNLSDVFIMFRSDGELYRITDVDEGFGTEPALDAIAIEGNGDLAAGPDPESLWLLHAPARGTTGTAELLALDGPPTTPTLTFEWELEDPVPTGMATRGNDDHLVSAGLEVGFLENMGGGYGVLHAGLSLPSDAGLITDLAEAYFRRTACEDLTEELAGS